MIDKITLNGVDYPIGGAGIDGPQKLALINFVNGLGGAFTDTNGQALLDAFNEAWTNFYSVRNNLTHCSTSNSATTVDKNASYSATLTAEEDYTITSVTVMMGGVDITSTAYSAGVISIAEVTGAIVITAVAASDNAWTDGVPYNLRWTEGKTLNTSTGAETDDSSMAVSQFLPCEGLTHIEATGIYDSQGIFYYDDAKNYIGRYSGKDSDNLYSKKIVNGDGVNFFRMKKQTSQTNSTAIPRDLPVLGSDTAPTAGQKYQLEITHGLSVASATGRESSSADSYASGFAFCYGFSSVKIWPVGRCFPSFYDANKTYLSTPGAVTTDEFSIPSNATYMRISFTYAATGGFPYVILQE